MSNHPQCVMAAAHGPRRYIKKLLRLLCSIIFALSIPSVTTTASSSDDDDDDDVLAEATPVSLFYETAKLVGGVEDIYFDDNNDLWVCQLLGFALNKIDPESGQVLEGGLSAAENDSVFFVDDVRVSSNGTVYWSDGLLGTYFAKPPPGSDNASSSSFPLLPFGTIPNANSLALSSDETRLFLGECWDERNVNRIFEYDLSTGNLTTLVDGVPGCAANAFEFHNEALYIPRPFEGRVIRLDLLTGEETNVTTGWGVPNAVKLDANADFVYALNVGVGEIARIDIRNLTASTDTDNNRQVIAKLTPGYNDNLALDKDDRVYVSSNVEGRVSEVMGMRDDGDGGDDDDDLEDDFRIVSPGNVSTVMGVAVIGNSLYTCNPLALYTISLESAELTSLLPSIPVTGVLRYPTVVASWDTNLVLVSFVTGIVALFDPNTQKNLAEAVFEAPIDAAPFDAGLLVTESATDSIVYITGPRLETRVELFNLTGVRFIAGNDHQDVYVTSVPKAGDGAIHQIVANGTVLDAPRRIIGGLDSPEGIAPCGKDLLVVVTNDMGGSVKVLNIESGAMRTVARNLSFFPPHPFVHFGFANDVVVAGEEDIDSSGCVVYVSSDRKGIYRVEISKEESSPNTDAASTTTTTPTVSPIIDSSPSSSCLPAKALYLLLVSWLLSIVPFSSK